MFFFRVAYGEGLPAETHTSILMQGSGTFAVESVFQSNAEKKRKVFFLASKKCLSAEISLFFYEWEFKISQVLKFCS